MTKCSYVEIEARMREHFRLLGALDERNHRDVEAMLALAHDDVVWEIPYMEKPMTMQGKPTLRAFWGKNQGVSTNIRYDIFALIVDEAKQTGSVQVRAKRTLVKTGDRYENLYVYFFRLEDGKFVHVVEYANPILAAPMNKALGLG